jgi:hypothetical protein
MSALSKKIHFNTRWENAEKPAEVGENGENPEHFCRDGRFERPAKPARRRPLLLLTKLLNM